METEAEMTSSVAMMTSPAATSPSSSGGWKAATGSVHPATAAAALMLAGGSGGGSVMAAGKDSGWLTLEVCREYARQRCSRSDADCRYAHPPPHVDVQNGRVVCCFDSIKGRCQRSDPPCKYLHPPQHLKEQLLQNGRNNLLLKSYQRIHCLPPTAAFIPLISPYMVANGSGCYAPYYSATAAQNPVVIPSSAPALTEATPTAPPTAVAQPCPHPEVQEASINDGSYTTVMSPPTLPPPPAAAAAGGGCHYWTLAPSPFAGSHAASAPPSAVTGAQFCPAPLYYQNGGCCAMMLPKNNGPATAAPCGKNSVAVYPYSAAAVDTFHQMALPVNGQYPVAIAVPSSVGSFYGC